MYTVRVGDADVTIVLEVKYKGVPVDVSVAAGCVTKQILLRSPSGTVSTKTALYVTDGTDSLVGYDTVTTDLSEAGRWKVMGYFDLGTRKFHTSVGEFEVEPVLS